MAQEIRVHELANGLVLLGEVMDWVESAAFTITVPAGCSRDPADRLGLANFACEMTQRGCGKLNSRQVVEALDRLGADQNSGVTQANTSFAAAMLADNLTAALAVYADVVRRPLLPKAQLEEARQVCFHELQSLEDDLAQRSLQAVKDLTYPDPLGRSASGRREHVADVSIDDITNFVRDHYLPNGCIISVAGKIDWEQLKDCVEEHFGDWAIAEQPQLQLTPAVGGYRHLQHESNQTHLAIAYEAVPYRHADYFKSRGAVGVLSDGMSSRLFTEVREIRGLCYTVYATYHSLRDSGRIMAYAGTSTERAQETLDVMVAELVRLADGINESELHRLKARVRSALIMQQEMSSARSGSMAADWYHLGRVRTMDEISTIIENLDCETVNRYLAANPPGDFTIATLGSKPLEVPVGVS